MRILCAPLRWGGGCRSWVELVPSLIALPDLALPDRIGFAARFLSTEALSAYVKKTMLNCVENGKLEGLYLTGLGPEGFQLLQKYLDRTGDVQTVALLSVRTCLSKKMEKEVKQAEVWWKSYSELLNNWQFWHQRAKLNVMRRQLPKSKFIDSDDAEETRRKKLPSLFDSPQVRIRCKHCGESLPVIGDKAIDSGPKSKTLTSCPRRSKPLPRCAICMIPLGYPNNPNQPIIDNWFVWCQTCGHGGHANHVEQWFETHSECPGLFTLFRTP